MRTLQKQIRELKMPSINFNRIVAQSQELLKIKHEADKNNKLSQGMLLALDRLETELDSY
jgi:hypothetical protein